jgi:hypothetical protein
VGQVNSKPQHLVFSLHFQCRPAKSSAHLKKTANFAVESPNSLAGRGLSGPKLPKIQCIRGPSRDASQPNKPMPRKLSEQEAKQVQIRLWLWELWTTGTDHPKRSQIPIRG